MGSKPSLRKSLQPSGPRFLTYQMVSTTQCYCELEMRL